MIENLSNKRCSYEQLLRTKNEPIISGILSQCYCEWVDLSHKGPWVECFEELCIALGYSPLNMDGNPTIGKA